MTRLDRLRSLLPDLHVDAVLVSDVTNVGWVTGFRGSSGFAVISADRSVFITDARYRQVAGHQVKGSDVIIFQTPKTAEQVIAEVLAEVGVKQVGFESASTTVETHRRWVEKFPDVELVPIADAVSQLRRVKDAEEIGHIRAACGIADLAFTHIQRMIRPGVREIDIELDLEFFIRRQGAGIAFPSIVVSGPNSASPHGHASERALEVGDLVTLDFGATVEGYHSDITRTLVVGDCSDRTREIYETVLRSQLAALAEMKPGVSGKAVDAAARAAMGDLASFFGHGLGHTLGRLVHDGGGMSPLSEVTLEVGQIWTVEPGIYIPDFGGCRIEDDVLITETGIEILTHSPKDLIVTPTV